MSNLRKGFTLIELLIVIAIIAVLAIVVVLVLNPVELLRQGRDSNRLSDMSTLNEAITLTQNDSLSLGSAGVIYVSLPDPTISGNATSNCNYWGLTPLPSGTVYQCSSPQNYKNTNGTGWIPIHFTSSTVGSPISTLSVDPTNQSSTGLYYSYATTGTKYELTTDFESQKYIPVAKASGASSPFLYAKGTSLSIITEDYGCSNGGPCIWVEDYNNNRIEKFDANGNYLGQFNSAGTGPGPFDDMEGIAIDQYGNIYDANSDANSVQKFDSSGNYLLQFGSLGSGTGQFNYPATPAVDKNGNVYIADNNNYRVEKFDPNGNYLSQFGSEGTGNGQFVDPWAIGVDATGNIYVGDAADGRVEKFDPNGNYLSQFPCASGPCAIGSANGELSTTGGGTNSITFDDGGNIYLTDWQNGRVEKYDQNGNYLSQIGCPSGACSPGTGNGQFGTYGPQDVAIDQAGNLYVDDNTNNRIEKFDPNGNYLSQFPCASGACAPGSDNGQTDSVYGIVIQ